MGMSQFENDSHTGYAERLDVDVTLPLRRADAS